MDSLSSPFSPLDVFVRSNEVLIIVVALGCAVVALLLSCVAVVRSGRSLRTRSTVDELHVRTRSLESAEDRRLLVGLKGQHGAEEAGDQRSMSF